MNQHPGNRRRIGAGALIFCGLGALLAPAAHAAAGADVARVDGASRYDTAVKASADFFPAGGSSTVVLASGDSTVDALAASYVAGANAAPVLLTPKDALPADVAVELRRLGAENVVLAGGDAVIGDGVEQALAADYDVQRADGADRYETAALLAGMVTDSNPDYVFLASGPADAAVAAPLAAGAGWPVLLTDPQQLSAVTRDALAQYPDAQVVVLGGENAVSPAVATAAGASERLAGDDRLETSVAIAEFAHDEAGFDGTSVGLARGYSGAGGSDLADALVSGPVLGPLGAPLILTAGAGDLGDAARGYLSTNSSQLSGQVLVFGGTSAVSQAAFDEIDQAVTEPVEPTPDPTTPVPTDPTTPPAVNVAPTVTSLSGLAQRSTSVRITFSEVVTGLAASDLTLSGQSAGVGIGTVTPVTPYPARGATRWDVQITAPGGLTTGQTLALPVGSVVDTDNLAGPARAFTSAGAANSPADALGAVLTNAGGNAADFDAVGDVVKITYNDPLAAPAGAATVTIDGTTYTNGVDVTLGREADADGNANHVLTVSHGSQNVAAIAGRAFAATSGVLDSESPNLAVSGATVPVRVPANLLSAVFTDDYGSDGEFSHVDDKITLTFDQSVVVSGGVEGFFRSGGTDTPIDFYVAPGGVASTTLVVEYGGPPQVSAIAGMEVFITGGVFSAADPTTAVAVTGQTIS